MRCIVIFLMAMLHSIPSHAQTRTSTTATASTSAQATSTQMDSADRTAAQYWGLPLEDYRRYQALMKGVRGAISDPRISPIEVLGIHARDEAERRKYAEMFARLMAEDTQRVLQFQLEYDRAFRRLHPKLVALDFGSGTRRPDGLQATLASAPTLPAPTAANAPMAAGMSRAPSVSAGDRILVFTRDNCGDCDDLVRRAMTLVRQGVVLDLYIVGARSGEEAQGYARRVALDPASVSDRRVTLNVDGGTFARILPQQRSLPALVRKRGESLVQLAPTEL
jgi:integrating conjugative element protein (TIGR03759 family)